VQKNIYNLNLFYDKRMPTGIAAAGCESAAEVFSNLRESSMSLTAVLVVWSSESTFQPRFFKVPNEKIGDDEEGDCITEQTDRPK